MNDGLRIILDLRGNLYFFSIHERGELYESGRGFTTAQECLEQADLHRRLTKLGRWRDQEKAKRIAENQ